jgi:hypothetical protein
MRSLLDKHEPNCKLPHGGSECSCDSLKTPSICKAGRNVADSYWSEEDERQSIECGAARPITKADAEAIEIALTQSDTAAQMICSANDGEVAK